MALLSSLPLHNPGTKYTFPTFCPSTRFLWFFERCFSYHDAQSTVARICVPFSIQELGLLILRHQYETLRYLCGRKNGSCALSKILAMPIFSLYFSVPSTNFYATTSTNATQEKLELQHNEYITTTTTTTYDTSHCLLSVGQP